MSANVRWRPEEEGRDLHIRNPSALKNILNRAFDRNIETEIALTDDDMDVLRGILATGVEEEGIQEIIEALDIHESIVIEWVY